MLGSTVRIAFVHSFYRSENPSGENVVVEAEATALKRAGHEVRIFAVSTDDLQEEPLYEVRTALRVASGHGRNPLRAIRGFEPDIVHMHNLFPNYGRKWVRLLDTPVVVTLHNYRSMCAKATLFRDGDVCTLCPDGARWSGVRYACYRDSRLATLPLSWANRRGAGADPVLARADLAIVLSERMRNLYVSDGVDPHKLDIAPNFLSDDRDPGPPGEAAQPDAAWLFVGRLDEAKGILTLLERWPSSQRLRIVGDGPLRDLVAAMAADRSEIRFVGQVSREKVFEFMRASLGLVFPSRWYEGFPITYLEAIACGLPVVAFEPNVVADAVRQDGTGFVAHWDIGLEEQLNRGEERLLTGRTACRAAFERQYSESVFLPRRVDLYRGLM